MAGRIHSGVNLKKMMNIKWENGTEYIELELGIWIERLIYHKKNFISLKKFYCQLLKHTQTKFFPTDKKE